MMSAALFLFLKIALTIWGLLWFHIFLESNYLLLISALLCSCSVSKLCPTLSHHTYCNLPGSSVHGIFPGKDAGMGCHFLLQGNLPDPGIEPMSPLSPALAGRFLTTEPSGKPTLIVTAALLTLFTITRTWKQPKSPWMDEWRKWCIHTLSVIFSVMERKQPCYLWQYGWTWRELC